MNQVGGLPGWRWLFYLEGIPSIVCAVLVFFFMPNYPSTAKWLSAEEKELARERIEGELAARSEDDSTWKLLMTTLTEWRLYVHYLASVASQPNLFRPTNRLDLLHGGPSIFVLVFVHTQHHGGSGFQQLTGATDDSPTIRRSM